MLTHQQVVAVADKEISLRPLPETWLIDVSLETRTSELMSRLLFAADGHPLLEDDLARLEAYARVPDQSGQVNGLWGELVRFCSSNLPAEVSDRAHELDVAFCI